MNRENKKSPFIRTRIFGVPEGIRTPDLLVRSQTLYPAELQAHIWVRTFERLYTLSLRKKKVNSFFAILKKVFQKKNKQQKTDRRFTLLSAMIKNATKPISRVLLNVVIYLGCPSPGQLGAIWANPPSRRFLCSVRCCFG